jgi:hydroxymethylbilane synthase
LAKFWPGLQYRVVPIKTSGDNLESIPEALGLKGLFVKEIEEALLTGKIDLAVHSAKDLPTELPKGIKIGAVPERASAFDVLISRDFKRLLSDLPSRARVGTTSLRRSAQILALRSDLVISPLRGNIGTRLAKLASGEFEAIILAMAGLSRLGILLPDTTSLLGPEDMLPASGQGILALEVREDDSETQLLLEPLEHYPTAMSLRAERSFMRYLGVGCQAPAAAWAKLDGECLSMEGLLAESDGSLVIRKKRRIKLSDGHTPENLGQELASCLLEAGGRKMIERMVTSFKERP